MIFVALGAAMLAGVSDAMPADVLLWNNLYSGMSKAEVKSLYPDYKAMLSPGCPVRVLSTYKRGGLVSIILVSQNKDAACFQRAADDLRHQFGEPGFQKRQQSAMPIATANSVSFKDAIVQDALWRSGKKTVRFAPQGAGYNVIYTVRDDGKLY